MAPLEGGAERSGRLNMLAGVALRPPQANLTSSRAHRQQRREAISEWPLDKSGHQQATTAHRHSRRQADVAPKDELVYVRLETLGSDIGNLNTRAINERLVEGLFAHLLAHQDDSAASAGSGGAADNDAASERRNVNDGQPLQLDRGDDKNKADAVPAAKLAPLTKAKIEASASLASVRAQILSGSSGAEGARLATKCRASVERLICRLAYPSCHFKASDVSALVRPPCREDCLLLRDVLCPNLNWTSFAFELRQAINSTLKSTINSLDLATQTTIDQLETSARSSGGGGGDILKAHSNSSDNNNNNEIEVDATRHLKPEEQVHGSDKKAAGAGSGDQLAKGYNLNSSIHFYWPHEKSIEICEHLPPLRPKASHFRRHNHQRQVVAGSSGGSSAHETSTLTPPPTTSAGNARRHYHDRWWLWPICSNARLTETKGADLGPSSVKSDESTPTTTTTNSADCLASSDGLGYRGAHNRTRSGLGCQMWTSQWPHKHSSSELLFDNMRAAENYCRNPGGVELKPWCYTVDTSVRWEYCDIPAC